MEFKSYSALLAIVISILASSVLAEAATIEVPIDHSTIQEAIDAADPGDAIVVLSGTYHENLNVTKPLALIGAGSAVVDAQGVGSAITLNADGCRVEGFEARNSDLDSGAGILVASNNNQIRKCAIRDNLYGLRLENSSGNVISEIDLAGQNSSKDRSLRLYSVAWNLYSNLRDRIFGRDDRGDGNFYGIYLSGSCGNVISDNLVGKTGLYALYLSNSNENVIVNNSIEDDDHDSTRGISLWNSEKNRLANNTVKGCRDSAIRLYSSDRNVLRDNAIERSEGGISISDSEENLLEKNLLAENVYGISLAGSEKNVLRGNAMEKNFYNFEAEGDNVVDATNLADGRPILYLVGEKDLVVDSSSNPAAVYCINCENITVRGLYLTNCSEGIYLQGSNGSKIEKNIITDSDRGVRLVSSSRNTLKENDIVRCLTGLSLEESTENVIIENLAKGCRGFHLETGILLKNASYNLLEENRALDNSFGVLIVGSSLKNVLRKNVMAENRHNFGSDGLANDVDSSNLVDGKPIFYIVNVSGVVLDSSSKAGALYCIGCENVSLKGLDLTRNVHGAYFRETKDSKIEGCNVSGCEYGIVLLDSKRDAVVENSVKENEYGIALLGSEEGEVRGNEISDNGIAGIKLFESHKNAVEDNKVEENLHGIVLSGSEKNTVAKNSVTDNRWNGIFLFGSANNSIIANRAAGNERCGIRLEGSVRNLLSRNDLFENGELDARDDNRDRYPKEGANRWDDGDLGNYYGDFECSDEDGDGRCDEAFEIPGGSSADRYPLSYPLSSPKAAALPA